MNWRFMHTLTFFIFALLLIVTVLLKLPTGTEETITYFPKDEEASFKKTETEISLQNEPKQKARLEWKVSSTLDRESYLRQDVGLLYQDGRLLEILSKWSEKENSIQQEKFFDIVSPSYFQAISFHHAELHESQDGNITSVQATSEDSLYTIAEPNKKAFSFVEPQTEEETKWKENLDKNTYNFLRRSWNSAIRTKDIPIKNYTLYPLTELPPVKGNAFPGLSMEKSQEVYGKLWEGLYRRYVLGIQTDVQKKESPLGSTIPLIGVSKNNDHLIVIIVTGTGESITLRQVIE